MTVKEAGSPNRREEGSNAGCLALQSGEEVTFPSATKTAAGVLCILYGTVVTVGIGSIVVGSLAGVIT